MLISCYIYVEDIQIFIIIEFFINRAFKMNRPFLPMEQQNFRRVNLLLSSDLIHFGRFPAKPYKNLLYAFWLLPQPAQSLWVIAEILACVTSALASLDRQNAFWPLPCTLIALTTCARFLGSQILFLCLVNLPKKLKSHYPFEIKGNQELSLVRRYSLVASSYFTSADPIPYLNLFMNH